MAESSNSTDSVIPSEVRDLIRESQKIHGWVERLAEHADEARPEVYEKVFADYETRLAGVNESLAEHRTHLVATVDTRRSELESLRADRDEQAADLEEARLRHAVGEFDDKTWGTRRDKIQEGLDDLDELLASEEETVAELDEIIASIGSTGPRLVMDRATRETDAAEGSEPPDVEAPMEEAADAALEDEAAPIEAEDAGSEIAAADVDEEPSTEPAVAEVADGPGSDTAIEDDGEGGEYLDELEFLESLSLGDSDRFDAVSAMLDDEEGGKKSD